MTRRKSHLVQIRGIPGCKRKEEVRGNSMRVREEVRFEVQEVEEEEEVEVVEDGVKVVVIE